MMDPTPPHTVAPLSHLSQPQLSTILEPLHSTNFHRIGLILQHKERERLKLQCLRRAA